MSDFMRYSLRSTESLSDFIRNIRSAILLCFECTSNYPGQ